MKKTDKILIEDSEIIVAEEASKSEGTHKIEGNKYFFDEIKSTTYSSDIFEYQDYSVLLSKVERFDKDYYKVVLFSDEKQTAWQLILISCELSVKIRRLSSEMFFIIGNAKNKQLISSQVSFCKIKQNGKVEEITLNLNRLMDVKIIDDKAVLLAYAESDASKDTVYLLSLYSIEGSLIKNFYEYRASGPQEHRFELLEDRLRIFEKTKKTKKEKFTDIKIFEIVDQIS